MAFKIWISISYRMVQTSVSPGGKGRRLLIMKNAGSLLPPGLWEVGNSLNLTTQYTTSWSETQWKLDPRESKLQVPV